MNSDNSGYQRQNHCSSRRACEGCNKKKTKCDRRLPACGLCERTFSACMYPSVRKPRRKRSKTDPRRTDQLPKTSVPTMTTSESAHVDLDSSTNRIMFPSEAITPPHLLLHHSPFGKAHQTTNETSSTYLNEPTPFNADPMLHYQSETAELSTVSSPNTKAREHRLPGLSDLSTIDQIELVDIFFDKIQAWLPLLHRPRFYSHYMEGGAVQSQGLRLEESTLEEQLIFVAIFALASPYSTSSNFLDIIPHQRGDQLIIEANTLCDKIHSTGPQPSLLYLQGCILFAFCCLVSGPIVWSSGAVGICVRLAYELDLINIDLEDANEAATGVEDWVRREELRRAWWLVWELDAFCSTVSRRPYTTGTQRMRVHLPCSDEFWFAETPVSSNGLHPKPLEAWKCLQGSPNQDARAYYLIAKYLSNFSHNLPHIQTGSLLRKKNELETALHCFRLALPPNFNLEARALSFSSKTFGQANFIIAIHLILSFTMLNVAQIHTNTIPLRNEPQQSTQASCQEKYVNETLRTIGHWDPNYICFAHPFLACSLLRSHISVSEDSLVTRSNTSFAARELPVLALSHLSRYWKLATIFQALIHITKRPYGLNKDEAQLARRFATFFPHDMTRKMPADLFYGKPSPANESHAASNRKTRQRGRGQPIVEDVDDSIQSIIPEISGLGDITWSKLGPNVNSESAGMDLHPFGCNLFDFFDTFDDYGTAYV